MLTFLFIDKEHNLNKSKHWQFRKIQGHNL